MRLLAVQNLPSLRKRTNYISKTLYIWNIYREVVKYILYANARSSDEIGWPHSIWTEYSPPLSQQAVDMRPTPS